MLVFDIETTGLLSDPTAVMTCGTEFNTGTGRFSLFGDRDADSLVDSLLDSGIVSGYNIHRFDMPMLERQTKRSLDGIKVLDPFQFILKHTGKMVGLDTVLGWLWDDETMRKSDKGANAIALWRAHQMGELGKLEELRSYCALDVYLETAVTLVAISEGLPINGKQMVMTTKDALTYRSQDVLVRA